MIHYVYGNGESRKGFGVARFNGVSWGCNAVYRDTQVDNLVVMDYGMQGEVIQSGYAKINQCYFADWNVIPTEMKTEFTKDFDPKQIKEFGTDKGVCVINGKKVETLPESGETIISKEELKDLKARSEKESGLYIIYPDEKDLIQPITDPKEWSAGSTAVHLACQDNGCKEVYMFGFDLSSFDRTKNINNIYKGTDNYLPEYCKGTSPHAWRQQLYLTFREFSNIKFNWIGHDLDEDFLFVKDSAIKECANVEFKTYDNIRL